MSTQTEMRAYHNVKGCNPKQCEKCFSYTLSEDMNLPSFALTFAIDIALVLINATHIVAVA